MAATTTVTVLFFFAVALAAGAGDAAFVEHTFVVRQMSVRHLCNDTVITVVNGQLPGPAIELREGDSVAVHVVNESPYGLTIHWHGVKQQLNCWADGAGMITQCPIQPNSNFTYRFDVAGQEGTLWWHAHVAGLRATIHGAIFIRPRAGGVSSYPFPRPDREIPIVIGEWWEMDLVQLDKSLMSGFFFDMPRGATINGKLGDLYTCSGITEDNYVLNVKHGETYLLRIVNAALFSEYYLKIAGHKFTVVATDANYVKPYTTDMIAIAPGETVDALVVADAPHGSYYMVVLANQPPAPAIQIPLFISRGVVRYNNTIVRGTSSLSADTIPVMPEMPEQHDALPSFYFRGNLTSLPHPQLPPVPINVDEQLLIALDSGYIIDGGDHDIVSSSSSSSPSPHVHPHKKKITSVKNNKPAVMVAMMNNVSFQLPSVTPLLEAFYYNNTSSIDTLQDLPDRPPKMFTYSDVIEPTSKATLVRRLPYNTTVEIVFQSPLLADSYSNPMHLHGHDFFVLAQGIGKYDAKRDVKTYNLVDPPVKNTVHVPIFGWAAIRFVTRNPGVWYMHCHYEHHSSTGMAVALVVKNGPTLDTSLPPPPADYPSCHKLHNNGGAAYA